MFLVSLRLLYPSGGEVHLYGVAVGRPQRPYDLLWPVAKRRTFAVESGAKVTEDTDTDTGKQATKGPATTKTTLSPSNFGTFEDLREYARRLLVSLPDPEATGVRMKLPAEAFSPLRGDLEREEEGALTGCREAVEILTRNPQKGAFVWFCVCFAETFPDFFFLFSLVLWCLSVL